MNETSNMRIIKLLNPENATENEVKNYRVRNAARGVVIDESNKIALLHVSKENYYKLPGGGIEDKEDHIDAFKRECLEEIGCEVEIIKDLGLIVEYRKIFGLKQTSYCYLAKLKGSKGSPEFTESETKKGFKEVWLTLEEAKGALEREALSFEGKAYIVPRDIAILNEVKIVLGLE